MIVTLSALAFAIERLPSAPFLAQFVGNGPGQKVKICLDGRKAHTTFAGKLVFRDSKGTWSSVCSNVRAPIARGRASQMRTWRTSVVGGNRQLAGNIVAASFARAVTPDQCAGLQLAVWEALEDGGRTPDFLSGRFQALASPAVLAFAQDAYGSSATESDATFVETGDKSQEQLTPLVAPTGASGSVGR